MSLALSCSCGARFEVEETFAGQTVSCPDCQSAVQAPILTRSPLRTSGYAIASVVAALVLACTGVGTLLAVVLGIVALVSIHRHRDQIAGTGYAIFGVTAGVVFTGVFVLAITRGEPFGADRLREQLMGSQVDRGGPLEIIRRQDGFAITRPSQKWGVSREHRFNLLLMNLSWDAYLEASADWIGFGQRFRTDPVPQVARGDRLVLQDIVEVKDSELKITVLQVRQSQARPTEHGLTGAEAVVDARMARQPWIFLIRVLRPVGQDRVYVLRAWVRKRRLAEAEPEIRQAMNSFRLLDD